MRSGCSVYGYFTRRLSPFQEWKSGRHPKRRKWIYIIDFFFFWFVNTFWCWKIKKRRILIGNLSMGVLFFLNTDTLFTFSRKSWHWPKVTSWLLSAKFSTRSSLFIFFGGWGRGADIMALTSGTQVLLEKCTFLLFGGGGGGVKMASTSGT